MTPGAAAVADLIGLRARWPRHPSSSQARARFDGQSAAGKVPAHVAALAAEAGIARRARRRSNRAGCRHVGVRRERLAHRPRRIRRGSDGRSGPLADRGRGRAGALARLRLLGKDQCRGGYASQVWGAFRAGHADSRGVSGWKDAPNPGEVLARGRSFGLVRPGLLGLGRVLCATRRRPRRVGVEGRPKPGRRSVLRWAEG